jgi:hypothetical protein
MHKTNTPLFLHRIRKKSENYEKMARNGVFTHRILKKESHKYFKLLEM